MLSSSSPMHTLCCQHRHSSHCRKTTALYLPGTETSPFSSASWLSPPAASARSLLNPRHKSESRLTMSFTLLKVDYFRNFLLLHPLICALVNGFNHISQKLCLLFPTSLKLKNCLLEKLKKEKSNFEAVCEATTS